MKYGGVVTPLAWDVARELSGQCHFDGEIVVTWEGDRADDGTYGSGYDHNYLLSFERRE